MMDLAKQLESCCGNALCGDWRESTNQLGSFPAWIATQILPPQTAALTGKAVVVAPHPFVTEAARVFGVQGNDEQLRWELAWRLFQHAATGFERAISIGNWSEAVAYGEAAMAMPGGSTIRQAVIEMLLENAFVAAILAQQAGEKMAEGGGPVSPVEPATAHEPMSPFEATNRLLEATAQADQYPTLCDHALAHLLRGADRPILDAINLGGPLWGHLCRLAARSPERQTAGGPARQWLKTFFPPPGGPANFRSP